MWSNVISIGKEYDKEIEYILQKLRNAKDLSYASEESNTRLWLYLASNCDVAQKIENEIYDMLSVVFLSFMKLRFFLERLPIYPLTYAKCALLSSMLHFDSDFEENVVAKTLSQSMDYNVDGLFNFRMRPLKDAWGEICDVAARLLEGSRDDRDVFDVAGFISGSDGGKNLIATDGQAIDNVTKRRKVELVRLFDDKDYDLLNAIIKEKPCEIQLKNAKFSEGMRNTLRKIAKVVELY